MDGKVVIVTGAASGIGLATSKQLLQQGAIVIACDIQEQTLENEFIPLRDHYGERVRCAVMDVTNREHVKHHISTMQQIYGQIDGYANVAGTGGHRLGHESISETTDDEYDHIMDLNTRATFIALGEVLRPDVLSDGGSVVCVGSMFGNRGFKNGAVFAASKHAIVGLARSAALEAGVRGVRVNVVEPGAIDTPMHKRNMEADMPDPTPNNPIPKLGRPEDVAGVISFLLGDQSKYVTGATHAVDGGANA